MNWLDPKNILPECPYEVGPLHHSNRVEFKICANKRCDKPQRLRGIFFKQSGGFFRHKRTGMDYSLRSVTQWRYLPEAVQ